MITLQHHRYDSHDLVHMSGRLGGTNASEVGSELVQILEGGPGILHLDLAELSFLDSLGLSTLISLLKRARRSEGDVILYNMNDRVRSLFELTRLHEIFEIRDDDDSQLNQIAS